jgi:hypothetical protein
MPPLAPGYVCARTDFDIRAGAFHYDGVADVSILASRVQLTHRSRCLELGGLSGAIDPWGESSCRARLGLCAKALDAPNLRNAGDQPENRRRLLPRMGVKMAL